MCKAAIDQCLTVLNRVFSIPRCEKIVADIEKIFGPAVKGSGLTLSFLQELIYYYYYYYCCYYYYYYYYDSYYLASQELIYRCRSPHKIEWMLEYIWDGIDQKYLSINDLSIVNMKSATRTSISDVALHQRKLKEYLTGQWLDTMNLQSDAKSMLRDIFQSYPSYRKLYNPGVHDDPNRPVDRTFMLRWHPAAVEALNLFELAIVTNNAQIAYTIRDAVRRGMDAADTLALRPFLTSVETIREALNPTTKGTAVGDSAESGTGNDNNADDDTEAGNMSWRLLRRRNKNMYQLALAPAKQEHISAGACAGETRT